MVVHRGKNKRARITGKSKRQWCAREKLLIIKHAETVINVIAVM
jgi:protein associated with RNAse G/E